MTRGDKRNAVYAEVSRLRGRLPTLPVPEVSDRLAAYLDDPIVAGDERLRLRVLIIKGETDEDLDPALSQRSWSEALGIAEKIGDAGWTNRARGELGLVAFLQGDTNTAIVNLGQALKVAESSGDTSSVVRWLTLFGHGYVELNRPEQALDFYDRALKIAGTIPELQLPLMTYVGKADVLTKLGRPSEAEQLLNTALEAARRERALGYQAELTLRLGRIALERKQTDRALEATANATALARAAGGNRILIEVALERARLLRSSNRVADADATLRTGISTARAMGDRLLLPRLLAQLADVRLSRGRVADAATLLEEADDIVEGLITRASSPWVRSRIIAGWDDVLVTRIRLEGERSRGNPARLFSVLERARGRSLLELLNSNSIASANRPAEWRTGERKIASLQLQLLRTTDRATRQRLLDQIFVAEEQLAPVSTQLFAEANRSARSQVSLAQVRAALKPDELLLEYVLAEPSSFTVAVTRTDSRLIKLPGRSVIEAQIQSLVRAIQDGQLATNEAKALGTTLVGAVSNIARFTRLIVSADGMTHTVPLEMLVSQSGTLLLETHVVSYVPSASTLVALRARARRASRTQMALAIGASPDVAANTTASVPTIGSVTRGLYDIDAEQLRPLPSAGNEARAVVAAFPARPSTVLVGNAATEQAVKSQPLANFRLMHFAAHGIVSTKSPARSAIVLRPAAGEDGLLQAREILGLRLNADLVTLSACDTGTGTVHGQEGVASLVRPFIAAGARAVVANLWAADDSFSLSLMSEFYRRLASGADVGESLRQAKLKMRQQFGPVAVPKLWSGILASGDAAIGRAGDHHAEVIVMNAPPGAQRRTILNRVLTVVDRKFMGTERNTAALRERHEQKVLHAQTKTDFEDAINGMLRDLAVSHVGFFHESTPRAAGRIAIAATLMKAQTSDGVRWMFQDVHPGGVAAQAGIQSGDVLLKVVERDLVPPEAMPFVLGETYTFTLRRSDQSTSTATLTIPGSKEKQRPIVVPDKVVNASRLPDGTGLIRVSMFPGILGMDVARDISRAIADLACERLVIDLRGNTGGGIGCLRVMSHLCPDRRGVGYSVSRDVARRGFTKERLPAFDRIPTSKLGVVPLIFRFARARRSVAVFTEALGHQSHHGQVAMLVNEHSASAAEMVAAFASEYRLATLVGVKTAGRLVATSAFKVGLGYRVVLPVAAYYTWNGTNLEGSGVVPNIEEPLSTDGLMNGEDNQLTRAVQCLQEGLPA